MVCYRVPYDVECSIAAFAFDHLTCDPAPDGVLCAQAGVFTVLCLATAAVCVAAAGSLHTVHRAPHQFTPMSDEAVAALVRDCLTDAVLREGSPGGAVVARGLLPCVPMPCSSRCRAVLRVCLDAAWPLSPTPHRA